MSEELKALADKLEAIADNSYDRGQHETGEIITNAVTALRRLAAAGEQKPVAWQPANDVPNVGRGSSNQYILAVYRNRGGKVYSFAAEYLNAYPLRYEYGCPKGASGFCDECSEDGCPTTGWHVVEGADDDGYTYHSLTLDDGDEIKGWREVPQWGEALSPQPAPGWDAAIDGIATAESMLSAHMEEFHDFEYEPHAIPLEVASLLRIQHHLAGSLIDKNGEALRSSQSTSDAGGGVGKDWTGKPCPYCKGTGENLANPMNSGSCDKCGGTGDEYAVLSNPAAADSNASAEVCLLREKLSDALAGGMQHWSDCAVYSAPAYEPSECRCGVGTLAQKYEGLLKGVMRQFRKKGCECTFPSETCCSYAEAEACLANMPASLASNASADRITVADIRAHVGDGMVSMQNVIDAANGILASRASTEARLREANKSEESKNGPSPIIVNPATNCVLCSGHALAADIARVMLCLTHYADGQELRGSWLDDLIKLKREAHEIIQALSPDPHASDCEKQGWLARDVEAATKRVADWEASDRPADVTALLTECRKFIAYAACYDDDVQSHKQRDDLVSRIDAFTVGRR